MKPLVIIDVDGVISDFKSVDNSIIEEMYKGNKLVFLLDKFLWFLNGMDVITNNFGIFRFRIRLYSLLNGSSYLSDMQKYKDFYVIKSSKYFESFINKEYNELIKQGFDVVILSCDIFASFVNHDVKVVENKRNYVKRFIYKNYKEVYVVGNNYMDDILSGLKLRKKCVVPVNIIYVGKSKIVKAMSRINKFIVKDTMKDAIKFIFSKKNQFRL